MDEGFKKTRKENPREHANPLSAAFFCYTLPTFFAGYRRDLEQVDLTETFSEHKSTKLGNRIEKAWDEEVAKARKANRTPSLRRVLMRVFGWEFLWYGLVLAFTEFAIKLQQPILLGKLVRYFTPEEKRFVAGEIAGGGNVTNKSLDTTLPQPLLLGELIRYFLPGQSEISKEEAYMYAAGVVLCSLITVFIVHPYMMGVLHLGMKMRVACCSLIYRKALRLSQKSLAMTTAGNLVNLLSNDVNRFDISLIFAHQLWVGPLETAIVTYLMYLQIGASAVYGVIIILLFAPLQMVLGKKVSTLRLRTALRTDERVRLMNEIISGIQVIKMYTWEKPFAMLVDLARRYEIKSIRGTSYIRAISLSFIIYTTRISVFTSVLAYVLLGNRITAEQVFVITSFHNVLRQAMTIFFPQGITQVAEVNVSIGRLNKFLISEENEMVTNYHKLPKESTNVTSKKSAVIAENDENNFASNSAKSAPVSPSSENSGIFLENITAKWSEESSDNTLSNITLSVKPGRLVAVIGPVGSGKSSLLYAILNELPLLDGKIYVCGEMSYAAQEPWLFAGTVRQNILFGQPMDKLRYKTVVRKCALERDFELFSHSDKTRVGERGVSLSGGQRARINLARAVYKQADIYLLDDPLSAVDTHVGKQLFENCISGFLRDKCVILITHQLQYLKEVDHIVIMENGKIKGQGTYKDLKESGVDFAKMLVDQPVEEEEPVKPIVDRRLSIKSAVSIDDRTVEDAPEIAEQKSSGSVSGRVYSQYFKAGGNCCIIFTLFALFVLTQASASGGDYFITYWVNLEQSRYEGMPNTSLQSLSGTGTEPMPAENYTIHNLQHQAFKSSNFWDFDRDVCIYIYSAITVATVVLTMTRSFMFVNMAMRASTTLHDIMFRSITRARMRFFNTNSSGRILNRFSKDMGAIDELLPGAMVDVLQIGLTLIGIIVVVAIVNPWLMIPTFISGVVFYYLRKFYITTSRSIKRLEGITRSPVFYHINASINGLTTIRAFKAETILEKEFDNHQDLHSSAWYSFLSTSRAFGFWLDVICVIYIAIVTLSFLILGNEKFGGNVGLAITQAIGLTGMFQWGMRQSAELENQMTSVERVLEYTSVDQEPELESSPDKKPKESWPEKGMVEFKDLYLTYAPTDPPVLKNLNFVIQSKEKVGIVGRTGAGKSSLIAALFRLTDIHGQIIIDGVITNEIGLHDLRSKISIIPQEPVLFSGTMRKNLDPFDEYSDDVLWKALEGVELKEAVMDLTGGLHSKMSEGGSNFSVGQRQLVCLARAIIRNNKILVLDEATANVDPQTDGLIQTTIRKKFSDCTVLTIAHRLHTVMDSDKVLVMDAGQMVEFGHPYQLLQNKKGIFYGMVQQTGRAMTEALTRVAEESYRKQKKNK